jgi:hypothetical protein
MPRQIIEVEGRTYLLSMDDQLPSGGRLWALVRAHLIDELTGHPPATPITLVSDMPFTAPRVVGDGVVGLVGIPQHVFPPLAAQNYTVHLTVQAPGYLQRRAEVIIPNDQRAIAAPAPVLHATVITLNNTARLSAGETLLIRPAGPHSSAVKIRGLGPGANQVTFTPELSHVYAVGDPVLPVIPDDFAVSDLGDLMLHREPLVIYGRTVRASSNTTIPLAGAMVAVTGIWRRPPPANMSVPPAPPHLVSLQPPLYADRVATVGELRRRALLPVVGDDKSLLEDVPQGANPIWLSNRQNLATGDILLIDANNPDLAEYLAIKTIVGASTASQPAYITLDYPVAYSHRRNVLVQKVILQPPAAVGQQVAFDALVGDTCVFLDDLVGLAGANEVQVTGGPNPPEYHRLRRFAVISDAAGYYRLPSISRVGQLEIQATFGALTPLLMEFRPDYRLRENRLDFTFR